MIKLFSDGGRLWAVRLVFYGDRYGLDNKLVHDKILDGKKDVLVEFYDTRFLHDNIGQFVSRYYAETLLTGELRRCRYGYHRKNNPDNWNDPPEGSHPSCVWYGWRDHDNFRFIREEEVEWSVRIEPGGSIGLAAMAEIANKKVTTPRQLAELKKRLSEADREFDPRPTNEFLDRTYSI
jgi:hypothetical protein